MDKFFSRKLNRLIYLFIVYFPFFISSCLVLAIQFGYRYSGPITSFYKLMGWWFAVALPLSTIAGLVMLFTGWYKELRKIEQDNSYRWLASITIILNILIVVGFSVLNS